MFDEDRISQRGLNIRDLIISSVTVVAVKTVFLAIIYVLSPARLEKYGLTARLGQVELAAELIAIPLLGMLGALLVRGRFRFLLQVLLIVLFYRIVASEIAMLIVK